jgi:hypothetical protein
MGGSRVSFQERINVAEKPTVVELLDEFVNSLEPDERKAALVLLTDTRFSQDEVKAAFAEEGFLVSVKTVGKWRKKHAIQ